MSYFSWWEVESLPATQMFVHARNGLTTPQYASNMISIFVKRLNKCPKLLEATAPERSVNVHNLSSSFWDSLELGFEMVVWRWGKGFQRQFTSKNPSYKLRRVRNSSELP